MHIHLKRNEKLYLNGAVIRLDRRGTIELLNDAQFLLENHVMQAESATTPLRQVYFIVQLMLMDPGNAHLTNVLLQKHIEQLLKHSPSCNSTGQIDQVVKCVEERNYFEALKQLRQGFRAEVTLERSGQRIGEAA